MKTNVTLTSAVVSAALLMVARPAAQAQVLTNGGFESGLTGWTVANQVGSDGSFFVQTGTSSPVNLIPVPPPPQGTQAAMTDAQGPGSHILYQNFVVPVSVTAASISFSLFVNNTATSYSNPASLDFAGTALNQQVRVDILTATSNAFSVSAGDVLQNIFQTNAATALTFGYTNVQTNITSLLQANAGQTLRLRFAAVDNVSILNVGVDQVAVTVSNTAAPEPSSLVLAGSAVCALCGIACLRRRSRS